MIPGYRKFQPPPPAKIANPAYDLPRLAALATLAAVPSPETPPWIFGTGPDDPAERAAIQEYDGGLSRAEAEHRAGLLN